MRDLKTLTWKEFSRLNPAELTYVLPISALEQHGLHLPLGTDDYIAQAVLDELHQHKELSDRLVCLPTVHYGNSHEHLGFPGTMAIRCDTIVSLVRDVLQSMQGHGVKRLVLLNAHGGNTALLEAYAQEWDREYDIRIYTMSLWSGGFFEGAPFHTDAPLNVEIHAGELETSILEYKYPELVRMEEISPATDRPVELKPYYVGWNTSVLSPENGQLGMASKATPEKGKAVLEFIGNKFSSYLVDIEREAGLL